jgi:hypothetical protein
VSHEFWGTYGTASHVGPRPFVTDVLFYERLVIPTPPTAERVRWEQNGWNPGLQDNLLALLGARKDADQTWRVTSDSIAYPVSWDDVARKGWREEMAKEMSREGVPAKESDGWGAPSQLASKMYLAGVVPAYATGVTAVATYPSLHAMEDEIGVRARIGAAAALPAGALVSVLGQRLLVPEDPDRDDRWLLQRAVERARDSDFRAKRAAFFDWQHQFLRDGVTDQESIKKAVQDMADLLNDLEKAAPIKNCATATRYIFLAAPGTVDAAVIGLDHGFGWAAGAAFVSAAALVADRWKRRDPKDVSPSPAALFHDARRHLGWREDTA